MGTTPSRIAFVGGGNMASAIITGLANLDGCAIRVVDPDPVVRELHAASGHAVGEDASGIGDAEAVVLAVKPQVVEEACAGLAEHLRPEQLVVSILAGATVARLESLLPEGQRVVRTMPNTPMAIGEGMVALCAGTHAGDDDLAFAEAIFAPAATTTRVDEALMDAVTAVSGSGPAYLFRFAGALRDAAEEVGLDRERAALLVGRTLAGSITYLLSQEGFPAEDLRRRVTSPGGTTAAAMAVLDEAGFDRAVREAVAAAAKRSRELAR